MAYGPNSYYRLGSVGPRTLTREINYPGRPRIGFVTALTPAPPASVGAGGTTTGGGTIIVFIPGPGTIMFTPINSLPTG